MHDTQSSFLYKILDSVSPALGCFIVLSISSKCVMLQMAMVAKVLLVVLAFGCSTVTSQSTTGDYDDEPLTVSQAQLDQTDITNLEQKMMLHLHDLQQQLQPQIQSEIRKLEQKIMLQVNGLQQQVSNLQRQLSSKFGELRSMITVFSRRVGKCYNLLLSSI